MESFNFNLISVEELEGAELVYYEENVAQSTAEFNFEQNESSSQHTSLTSDLDHYSFHDEIQNPESPSNSDFSLSLSQYEENLSDENEDADSISSNFPFNLQQNFEASNANYFPSSSAVEIETEEQDEDEEGACNAVRNSRKRKKKANPDEWATNINKKKRSSGQEYVGKKRATTVQGQIRQHATIPARKMGPTCNSKRCKKAKKCSQFTENQRKRIFDNFWKMSWEEKQTFVCSSVDSEDPKERSKTRSFDKDNTMNYYLKINNVRTKVCRKMFLSTLAMDRGQVYNWLKKSNNDNNNNNLQNPGPSKRTINNNSQLVLRTNFLNEFFNRLPKCPSHYCRQTSTKIYLEPIVKTKSQLQKLYTEECKTNNIKPFTRVKFERVFSQLNLSLFKPKKDLCNVCVEYQLNHVSDDIYNNHQQRKNEARSEKKLDKNLAKAGSCHTLSMDLQQVKLCPTVQASASYFKQKLSCHNFTIYNLATRHATCYWFNKIDADLVASSFASCVVDYLQNNCLEPRLPINIYSDGCGYQNRNAMLSSALLSFSTKNDAIVTQKYLEKGHTQMEVDSVHSTIECKLKNEDIHIPSHYSNLSRVARVTGHPYEVKEVKFNFFDDYSDKSQMVYPSIRPGKAKVIEIRNLKYSPEGTIFYKLNHLDEYQQLPNKTSRSSPVNFPKLYKEPLKITDAKFSDLQDLKSVIPSEFHSFYNNLPHGKIKKAKK